MWKVDEVLLLRVGLRPRLREIGTVRAARDLMEQRAVRRGCVPHQEHLVHRARRRRLAEAPAFGQQRLCSSNVDGWVGRGPHRYR